MDDIKKKVILPQKKEAENQDIPETIENKTMEENGINMSVANQNDEQAKINNEITDEKKEKRPSKIDLKNKSELFKKIIDIALSVEKIEVEKKKSKEKNKAISEECKRLKAEVLDLRKKLDEALCVCESKQKEIDLLVSDVEHRNEVIDIVKADKSESSQEFKNALAASLKEFKTDFDELNSMEMSDEVGSAMADTLSGIFKILEKKDIHIQ